MRSILILLLILTSCGTVKKSSTYNQSLSHEKNFENQLTTFEKKGLLLTMKKRAFSEKLDSAGNVIERTVKDSEVTIKNEGEITTKEDYKGGENTKETIVEDTELKRKRSLSWWLIVIPLLTIWAIYK